MHCVRLPADRPRGTRGGTSAHLERVAEHGDLFAAVLSTRQQLG
ncbi:MAG TPA: hypothetical protein VGC98_07290 [Thermoleophilaceae bacterium]